MIGRGPAAFFGIKMLVLSSTPSRIGIMALVRSKAGPASCRAADRNATAKMSVATNNPATNNPGSVMRFISSPNSFDSRHRVSVHKLSFAEGELAKRAFNLKSEFAIQRDRGFIVSENGQFDSRQVQPFVGQINHGPHHRRPDAFALPVVAHHHSDLGLMPEPRPRRGLQADYAYNVAVNDSDQNVVAVHAFSQLFTNGFESAVRQLQRIADDQRRGVTLPQRFGVRRLSFANGDVHIMLDDYWRQTSFLEYARKFS